MAIAPNKNQVLKVETISIYTIKNITHRWIRLTFIDRIEVKELLIINSPE